MVKTLKYFVENNFPILRSFFNHIPETIVKEDLNNISTQELIKFCEENKQYLEDSLYNISENELIDTIKKEFILEQVKIKIPKMRINALLNTNKPYNDNELTNLNVNEDGLITLDDYFNFPRENKYALCLPINDTNSNYWIWKAITYLKDNENISFKIRLDPLIKKPIHYVNKMTIFSEPLNWEKLSKIEGMSQSKFRDENKGNETELFWQKINNELHFKCEELPTYKEIKNRGSRYFHAIYNIDKKIITHCDGSTKIYNENEYLMRNDIPLWDKNSKKYGKYLKIFQADGQINTDNFTSLITSYFVRNLDISKYFEKLKDNQI